MAATPRPLTPGLLALALALALALGPTLPAPAAPPTDPAVTNRLAAFEAQQGATGAQITALQSRLANLESSGMPPADLSPIKAQLDALQAAVKALPPPADPATLDALKSRLAALEASVKALQAGGSSGGSSGGTGPVDSGGKGGTGGPGTGGTGGPGTGGPAGGDTGGPKGGDVTPPAPGTVLATVHLTPGWATFGQPLPKGAARGSLKLGNLVTQTDVKTTWDGGSIRYAVVTAKVDKEADYPLTVATAAAAGDAAPAPFTPHVPDASVPLHYGVTWQPLGTATVGAGGVLKVSLSNATKTGFVLLDGLRVADSAGKVVKALDDGDATLVGPWTNYAGQGYQGSVRYAAAGAGDATATWTLAGLPAGTYQVAATWTPYANRATDAPFVLDAGDGKPTTVRVDETKAPAGLSEGVSYVATLPKTPTNDVWFDGLLLKAWRAVVAPAAADGTPHPTLRVAFDVYAYADGTGRVSVRVNNDLDHAAAGQELYGVDVSVDGKVIYSNANVAHGYLCNWRKVAPFGGFAEAAITPDFEPYFQARALPRYLANLTPTADVPTGPAFDILMSGPLAQDETMPGGRPEIAPYPDWVPRYVVFKDQTRRAMVLALGDLSGSFPVHCTQADGGRVSVEERPDFWFDGRGADRPHGDMSHQGPYRPDQAHMPSLAYVAYLITGDRHYYDEMIAHADYAILQSWPGFGQNIRHGAKGQMLEAITGGNVDLANGLTYGNQIRGFAWGLRDVADGAAYSADNDPHGPYLRRVLSNNLAWCDAYADAHRTPLGTYFEMQNQTTPDQLGVLPWQNDFVAWAIGHANDHGFPGGERLRDRLLATRVKTLADPTIPAQWKPTGWWRTGLFDTKTLTYTNYNTWADAVKNGPGNDYGWAGYYGPQARLSTLQALARGLPDAPAAWAALVAGYPEMSSDLANQAGWAIAPETYGVTADQLKAAAAGK